MSRKITPQQRIALAEHGVCTACAIRPAGEFRQCARCRKAEREKRARQAKRRHPYPQHLRSQGIAREVIKSSRDLARALRDHRENREYVLQFLDSVRLYEYEWDQAMGGGKA